MSTRIEITQLDADILRCGGTTFECQAGFSSLQRQPSANNLSYCTILTQPPEKKQQSTLQALWPDPNIAPVLTRASANIPLTAVNRFTPLHAAAAAGCEQVVFQLCEAPMGQKFGRGLRGRDVDN